MYGGSGERRAVRSVVSRSLYREAVYHQLPSWSDGVGRQWSAWAADEPRDGRTRSTTKCVALLMARSLPSYPLHAVCRAFIE